MFRSHGRGKTTVLNVPGKFIVRTVYPDGAERSEEWTSCKGRLFSRKWKEPSSSILTDNEKWTYEIWNEVASNGQSNSNEIMLTAKENPTFYAQDSERFFIWKITNYPWGAENCSLTVSNEDNEATIRSKNKKFFKRFKVPALSRVNEPLREDAFKVSHEQENNVLLIKYQKPEIVLQAERADHEERAEAHMKMGTNGDLECKQQ